MAHAKSTKKFEQRHLKDTLERRKGLKKTKQQQKLKQRQKARKVEENGGEAQHDGRPPKKDPKEALQSLSVDDFFETEFEVPEAPASTKKRRHPEHDDSNPLDTEEPPATSDVDDSSDDGEIQDQLDALAERDPEFHKYLQENEPELLDSHFGESMVMDASSADGDDGDNEPRRKKQRMSDDEDDDEDENEDEAEEGRPGNDLQMAQVDRWSAAMQEHSLRAAREVVTAFRSAVQDDDEKQFKYSISDADVYHKLLTSALKNIPLVLQHHLPPQEGKRGARVATDSDKFKTVAPIVKSHVMSIIQLLDTLSDAATLRLTLSATLPLLPYLLSFKKMVRDLCKVVTAVWASTSNTESTRVAAFLVLRKLMTIGDAGMRETILKSAYQGLVQSSRNTTVHSIGGINLMKNSAAELWGLDSSVGYTTGFSFIRQLAIHLRSSITNKSKESYKAVYNWQYTHSLDFWSRVLAMHCASPDSPLRPLIYPLVQVTLGALRLIPTATYFPLRFQLTRALLRISASTGTYIPLAASLYEVLNSAEMRKGPKNSTLKPLDFTTSIRAPKSYLRTRIYQDGVGEQVQELFAEFFGLWSKSIAFPELAFTVVVMLKRWLKDMSNKTGNKNANVNGLIILLVQKLEANARFIEDKRAKVDFAPNNRKQVDAFLSDLDWKKTPIGAYVKGMRRQKEEKAKVIEEARLLEQQKYEKSARVPDVEDNVDSEEDDSEV